jgi:hypothetical protein
MKCYLKKVIYLPLPCKQCFVKLYHFFLPQEFSTRHVRRMNHCIMSLAAHTKATERSVFKGTRLENTCAFLCNKGSIRGDQTTWQAVLVPLTNTAQRERSLFRRQGKESSHKLQVPYITFIYKNNLCEYKVRNLKPVWPRKPRKLQGVHSLYGFIICFRDSRIGE